MKAGSEAVEKADAAGPKTEREKDYVAAIARLLPATTTRSTTRPARSPTRRRWSRSTLRFPDDQEAGVFYALALNATAPPTDKTFANKQKAARDPATRCGKHQPNHPGVVHYLIHSDDTPQLAEAGLPAAMCYAKIAPAVPHALHMPSHIFTRLGLWQQSIDSNNAAHDAAIAYVSKTIGEGGFDGETVHTMDYLEYAYLQTAQDGKAKQVRDELLSLHARAPAPICRPPTPSRRSRCATRSSAATGRRRLRSTTPAIGFPLDKLPVGRGDDLVCPRARRRADRRHRRRAETEIGKLQALRDKLNDAKDTYWANQVEVQRLGASAVLAHAARDDKKAIELARAGGRSRRRRWTSIRRPRRRCCRRASCSPTCCSKPRTRRALQAYEESLKSEPNRFRSILGKARAAKAAGDLETSREAYKKLVALSALADSDRPELAEAKTFLSN